MSYKTIGTGVYEAPSPKPSPEPIIILGEQSLHRAIDDVVESMDPLYINAVFDAIKQYLANPSSTITPAMMDQYALQLYDAVDQLPSSAARTEMEQIAKFFTLKR